MVCHAARRSVYTHVGAEVEVSRGSFCMNMVLMLIVTLAENANTYYYHNSFPGRPKKYPQGEGIITPYVATQTNVITIVSYSGVLYGRLAPCLAKRSVCWSVPALQRCFGKKLSNGDPWYYRLSI